MIFKRPTSPVFWVPVPDTGQSRMALVDWRYIPGTPPPQMNLTCPETGDYTVEILDYLGAYEMQEIPGHIARQIINKDATGLMLAKLLLRRVPEFRNCKKVLFYQCNILNNG